MRRDGAARSAGEEGLRRRLAGRLLGLQEGAERKSQDRVGIKAVGEKFELWGLTSLRNEIQVMPSMLGTHVCPALLRYALASHFFWGLWSILQASMSTIEFGYLVSDPDG